VNKHPAVYWIRDGLSTSIGETANDFDASGRMGARFVADVGNFHWKTRDR
jgi:hypothetical protein